MLRIKEINVFMMNLPKINPSFASALIKAIDASKVAEQAIRVKEL
jgi:hypothetical protein